MRRLVSSDWQLDANPRDRYRLDFVEQRLPKLIEKYKVDQLLMLGDLCEQKDNHPASLVNTVVDILYKLSQQCEVIILQGNHDILHESYPFFSFVDKFKNITWISQPCVHFNKEAGEKILFLPHTRDYKKVWTPYLNDRYDYIFAHNIFTGVNTRTGHALAGIPPSIFYDDACVISGDVHEPQSFDVITYVGAPFTCDFGDDYEPRVLLLDGEKITSIKVGGPQKRLIEASLDNGVGPLGFVHRGEFKNGDIVKIRVNLQMKDVADWPQIKEQAQEWAQLAGLMVNTIQPIVNQTIGDRAKVVKGKTKTDLQYFDSFVKRQNLDDRTIETGRELME